MRDVFLHGVLGERFGQQHSFDVETAADCVRALAANFPDILGVLHEGDWRVVRGALDGGMDLDVEQMAGLRLGSAPLHFLPVAAGHKNDAVLQIVVGAALVGAAMYFGGAGLLAQQVAPAAFGATTYGNVMASIGLSLAVVGVSTLITPSAESGDEPKSYLLTGPTSQNAEGSAIQVVYGEVITGGLLVSSGMDVLPTGALGEQGLPEATDILLTSIYGDAYARSNTGA